MSRFKSAIIVGILAAVGSSGGAPPTGKTQDDPARGSRPWIEIRGIYGGVPTQIFDRGKTLDDYGVNAVWIGADGAGREVVESLKARNPGVKIFAEFNTMHQAAYLDAHPDAAPVGVDGKVCPPPDGWQGVCPTHPGYRQSRMDAFRKVLRDAPIDGIWLDYHHSHASWEQAVPNLPDTCFCPRCLEQFQRQTGAVLPPSPPTEQARRLLTVEREGWIRWRCGVFTDWVREFREILDRERPTALLGSFHCPWSETDFDGALRAKLALDLKAQSRYLDVLSIMPYHARFGHAGDASWISRQVRLLGNRLDLKGQPDERLQIWPIVQLSDWGKAVPPELVSQILEQGTRPPARGVMVFVWGTLHPQWEKVEEMGRFYRSIRP